MKKNAPQRRTRRVPENSAFYTWVIPVVFILFAVLLLVIVGFSAAVLVGVVQFR